MLALLGAASGLPAQELIHCPADLQGSGDKIDRGMYVPSYPGNTLGVVILTYGCGGGSGEVAFELTARAGSYDGDLIGVAQASITTSGDLYGTTSGRFDFHGAPVTKGAVVTVAQRRLDGNDDIFCFYNTGRNSGELCEGMVVETDGTAAPLDTDRREGMGVTVFPGAGVVPNTYWVAVVSRAGGVAGSVWRSNLGLLNRSLDPAKVTLRLHKNPVRERTLTIAPGAEHRIEDVVNWIAPGHSGSAALEVVSDQALLVLARTANTIAEAATCYPGGSFGQVFDGRTVQSGLVTGEIVTLTSLRENEDARTNIGFTNTGETRARIVYTLYDAAGTEVYRSGALTLAPGEWHQENRPFSAHAGLHDVDGGRATVRIERGAGIQVYASLLDAVTSDGATIWSMP